MCSDVLYSNCYKEDYEINDILDNLVKNCRYIF